MEEGTPFLHSIFLKENRDFGSENLQQANRDLRFYSKKKWDWRVIALVFPKYKIKFI